ncbi:MAG: efflux RND transporter periplasmic adaptor subunit, partial [Alphaproteobacteria bacterium]|nr:efflux RND transporter periplasmic adaptor subunit [Alphaproteobacteria bacterium]
IKNISKIQIFSQNIRRKLILPKIKYDIKVLKIRVFKRGVMFLKNYFKENRNIGLMIILGVVAGLLAMWLALKALKPVVRSVCTYVLESDEEKSPHKQGRVATIEAATVEMGVMTKRIATVGKMRANASVTLRAEMNGRIKELSFTEGTTVKEGDPIIKFEDADAQAELKQAEAEVMLRKADFERSSKLFDQKIGSTKDFDKAKAELAMAEGRQDAARAKLDKTIIHAPFSGTIGLIDVSVGAYVQAAQDLVTIVDSTPIKVEFKVPEKHVHDIGVGQSVEVRIDAFKDQVFHGAVEAVDAQVEAESHSIALKASIPNENGLLRPGLFTNVSLIIGEQGETILVDEAAVDREGEIEFVWIVEKGKARRNRVLTGSRENGKIEIIAGIRTGQIIVTAGQLKLGDGVKVKITNMPEANAEEKPVGDEKAKDAPKKEEDKDKKVASEAAPVKAQDVKPEAAKVVSPPVEEPKKEQPVAAPLKPEDHKPQQPEKPEDKPLAPADTKPVHQG